MEKRPNDTIEMLRAEFANVRKTAIVGHIRPDGDCISSCLALYHYLKDNYGYEADVYLQPYPSVFDMLPDTAVIRHTVKPEVYDVVYSIDCADADRIGAGKELFDSAKKRVMIDHHISNPIFGDVNYAKGEIGSACEVLYTLFEEDKINYNVAMCLYTGMVHDTGVFQYSSTSPETMRIAGELMKTGFDFSKIIDESFYQKTYVQNQVMGRVLAESIMLLDGKCIIGYLKKKDLEFYGVDGKDLDGIVSQLRLTQGVEVAMFIYELETQSFKVSLRSNGKVDVSKIAVYFGGGGHKRAAGCDLQGSMYDVINNISEQICKQFQELEI